MRQIGLIHHHARMRGAIIPIVVHRTQNIREYSTTDYLIMSKNHNMIVANLTDDYAKGLIASEMSECNPE